MNNCHHELPPAKGYEDGRLYDKSHAIFHKCLKCGELVNKLAKN